jgi:hypothetical protein
MSQATQIMMGLVMLCVIGFVIYLCIAGGYTLALKFHQGAGTKGGFWYKERPNWIPESWLEWAGSPAKFMKIDGVGAPNGSTYEVLEDITDVKKCMLKCDKKSSDPTAPECVGFAYNSSAQTCIMFDGIDLVDQSSSNVMYLYSSADYTQSAKLFTAYTSNTLTDAKSLVAAYTEANGLDGCKANCFSNTACTGFLFTASSKLCNPISNMNVAALSTMTSIDAYSLDTVRGTADTTQYWK